MNAKCAKWRSQPADWDEVVFGPVEIRPNAVFAGALMTAG
jgi:hypothetical protein